MSLGLTMSAVWTNTFLCSIIGGWGCLALCPLEFCVPPRGAASLSTGPYTLLVWTRASCQGARTLTRVHVPSAPWAHTLLTTNVRAGRRPFLGARGAGGLSPEAVRALGHVLQGRGWDWPGWREPFQRGSPRQSLAGEHSLPEKTWEGQEGPASCQCGDLWTEGALVLSSQALLHPSHMQAFGAPSEPRAWTTPRLFSSSGAGGTPVSEMEGLSTPACHGPKDFY